MKRLIPKLLLPVCLLLWSTQLCAQRIFVNTLNGLYEMTGGVGSCSSTQINSFCSATYGGQIFSSAVYNDTLYFLSNSDNRLYRVRLGNPGSCTYLTNFPITTSVGSTVNAITVDKNGILYGADVLSNELHRYNPYTGLMQTLGVLPFKPGGDLLFFKDKLLLSTFANGICEVNIADPWQSQVYMPTAGFNFFGLISFPYECGKNKVYGFSPAGPATDLVELDLENKVVVGLVCTLPLLVYDGASEVENGTTLGVTIDSIRVTPPCGQQPASIRVKAFSAAPGTLTYILDNAITNNDGVFTNVNAGSHHIKVKTEAGCEKDSTFTIAAGLSSIQLTSVNPQNCDQQNGSITVTATSGYLPITYSINNGPVQSSNQFNNLGGGIHTITIRDAGGCRRDTTVALNYLVRPDYVAGVLLSPSLCESNSGSITVQITGNTTGITTSLNNGPQLSQLTYNNLPAGQHSISVFKPGNCRYDTVVNVVRQEGVKPAIAIVKENQVCSINNGKITVNATGAAAPYTYNFSNNGFNSNNVFDKLFPGTYLIKVQDQSKCTWDTSVVILPYAPQPVDIDITDNDADCMKPKSGSFRIVVSGNQQPYLLQWEGQLHDNGTTFPSDAGQFQVPIINNDGCAVDTAMVNVGIILKPECDNVYVPNAFTPNNDKHNDVFRVIYGAGVRNMVLRIYNRYGQLVHEDIGGRKVWDGTLKGTALSSGTYVWTLYYETYHGQRKQAKGYVLLVR